ncbi:MAG: DNA translocase FtsK [Patescibacteria group bacterium]
MSIFRKNKKRKDEEINEEKKGLSSDTKRGILVIGFFTLAVISVMSFLGKAGYAGYLYFGVAKKLFGNGYWLLPILFFILAITILRSLRKFNWGHAAFFGSVVLTLSFLAILDFILGEENAGGFLGLIFKMPLEKFFSVSASLVILFSLMFISLLLVLNASLDSFWIFGKRKNDAILESEVGKLSFGENDAEEINRKKGIAGLFSSILPKPRFKVSKVGDGESEDNYEEINSRKTVDEDLITLRSDAKKNVAFKLPPIDLLDDETGKPVIGDINANVNIIKRTFENFGIEVEMSDVNVGPTVTQFTLKPAIGVKLAKIVSLQNDLSLALAAHPLRIEAPIPGRSLVGIEVPNKKMAIVRLKKFLLTEQFQKNSSLLSFAAGRDVSGHNVFSDIARMPHLLIAGATGSGKSVCIHDIILSLLYKNSPETLRFILIDPKRVELTLYNDIPHLLTPVIVEPSKAINTLKWAVNEMESRYRILEGCSVKDILSYNKNSHNEQMPYIIIVIDELADLMAAYGRDMEGAIVRLAQMARAVGIHLIVSTQRPSVEVITGLIKANITSRIAFQVASQVDSRTILDMAGAEKLLGRGDMLYLSGDASKPRRLQGVFISEKEVKKVTKFLREGRDTESCYDENVLGVQDKKIGSFSDGVIDDELYEEAERIIIEAGRASASFLQRRLRVGYARAARLLDLLEEKGIVGPADGARPREVFVKKDNQDSYNDNYEN